MSKKTFIISLFLLAYTFVLGHDIIPHHHDDDDHNTELVDAHSHHHHDDDHDTDSNDLQHLFSHFSHADGGFTIEKNDVNNIFSKKKAMAVTFVPVSFAIKEVLVLMQLFYTPSYPPYISPHRSPSGLRAPPASIV